MPSPMQLTRVLSLVLLLAGCGSAAKDFENICHAEERSGAASVTDPSERAMRIAQWIEANLTSSDAREAFAALASAVPEQRGELLRTAARESGYTGECPMADAR
jgi:hypothetical protein